MCIIFDLEIVFLGFYFCLCIKYIFIFVYILNGLWIGLFIVVLLSEREIGMN